MPLTFQTQDTLMSARRVITSGEAASHGEKPTDIPRRLPHATGHHQLGHSVTFFPVSIKPRPLTNYDVAQQHRCCYLFERNVIFLIPAKKSDRSNVNIPKHTAPKHTFKCSICRQHFTSKHNAERHEAKQHNLHGGPLSFQCPKCDKTLSRSYDLNRHLQQMHGVIVSSRSSSSLSTLDLKLPGQEDLQNYQIPQARTLPVSASQCTPTLDEGRDTPDTPSRGNLLPIEIPCYEEESEDDELKLYLSSSNTDRDESPPRISPNEPERMIAEAAEKATASNTDTATTSQAAALTDQPEVRFLIPTPLDPEYGLGLIVNITPVVTPRLDSIPGPNVMIADATVDITTAPPDDLPINFIVWSQELSKSRLEITSFPEPSAEVQTHNVTIYNDPIGLRLVTDNWRMSMDDLLDSDRSRYAIPVGDHYYRMATQHPALPQRSIEEMIAEHERQLEWLHEERRRCE